MHTDMFIYTRAPSHTCTHKRSPSLCSSLLPAGPSTAMTTAPWGSSLPSASPPPRKPALGTCMIPRDCVCCACACVCTNARVCVCSSGRKSHPRLLRNARPQPHMHDKNTSAKVLPESIPRAVLDRSVSTVAGKTNSPPSRPARRRTYGEVALACVTPEGAIATTVAGRGGMPAGCGHILCALGQVGRIRST